MSAHNKHCEDQAKMHLYITNPVMLSLSKQDDLSDEKGTFAPAHPQPSGSKQSFNIAVPGPKITTSSFPAPLTLLPAYPWHALGVYCLSSDTPVMTVSHSDCLFPTGLILLR